MLRIHTVNISYSKIDSIDVHGKKPTHKLNRIIIMEWVCVNYLTLRGTDCMLHGQNG